MPGSFDVTQIRAHLNDYLKEIDDLATTQEEVSAFAEFNYRLNVLNTITESCYQPGPDGSYPLLSEEDVEAIRSNYQLTLEQAERLRAEPGEGEAAVRMRGILRELVPMLNNDLAALQSVTAEEPTSLPELISKARQTAVDLGSQEAPTVGGLSSTRHHIQVAEGDRLTPGFFTETATVDPAGDYRRLLDRLGERYPACRELVNGLAGKSLEALFYGVTWQLRFDRVDLNASPEAQRENLLEAFRTDTLSPLGLSTQAAALEGQPEYLAFLDELSTGMQRLQLDYGHNKTDLGLADGANLDKRNVAMSRTAALFGKGGLVAEARPMTLIRNGQAVTGTFMEEAYGVNVSTAKAGDPLLNYQPQNFENNSVMDDVAAVQALDFICGNIDRNPGNFMFRFQPKSGTS